MKAQQTVSISGRTLVFALALVLAVSFAPMVATFASLMTLAVILAAALHPLVTLTARRLKIPREAAVTTVFAGLLVALSLAVLWIVPTIVEQGRLLSANLPQYLDRLQSSLSWLQHFVTRTALTMGRRHVALPPVPDLKVLLDGTMANAGVFVGSSLGIAGKALGLFGMAAVVLMLTFFLLLEGPALRAAMLSLAPPPWRPRLDAQIGPIAGKLGGYVQGTAIGIVGLAIYQVIVMNTLGLPLALALGILSALCAVIPMVGGFLGVIPPALVALSVSWQTSLWALVLGYFGHFVVANFVLPVVFARSVKLSPMTVTVAMLVGAEAMGVFGALIAVPLAAALQVLVQNLYVQPMEAAHQPDERDQLHFHVAPLPRLRLETALETRVPAAQDPTESASTSPE